jgi:thiamine-phosphate pyrophosphorylase
MPLHLPPPPIIYLITSGATTEADAAPVSKDFTRVLAHVRAAVRLSIPLVQLREKNLSARALYDLACASVEITRGSTTRLLVNDRADIARAARADGVHLTTGSLEAETIRRAFGPDFLVGVSTHSLAEAESARDGEADFAVFGPVFDTPSKRLFGAPLGLDALREAAQRLAPFPIIALGGITLENSASAITAGASGVAAIRLFSDTEKLRETVEAVRERGNAVWKRRRTL